MARDKSREKIGATEGAGGAEDPKRITWDGSNMRSVYANVANVTSGREEIFLYFGMNQAWHAAQRDVTVRLTDRIILSPFAAKRLATLLGKSLRDYESRYGPLDAETPPRSGQAGAASTERILPLREKESASEKETLLFQLMKDFKVALGYERSFKMLEKTLLGNRFLLGISKRSIQKNRHERLLDTCRRMDMPEDFLKAFKARVAEANYVHFGFEENEKTWVYKAYLEFSDRLEKVKREDPFLMHLGFKWDALDNAKRAVAKYSWYPGLSVEGIQERLSDIYDRPEHGRAFEIVMGILRMGADTMNPRDILYLEVSENNNPRKSFDINLYHANLPLKKIYPFLTNICQYYDISEGEFNTLYDEVKDKTFGHLSGGIDKEGRDFLTVYFGVEGYAIT